MVGPSTDPCSICYNADERLPCLDLERPALIDASQFINKEFATMIRRLSFWAVLGSFAFVSGVVTADDKPVPTEAEKGAVAEMNNSYR